MQNRTRKLKQISCIGLLVLLLLLGGGCQRLDKSTSQTEQTNTDNQEITVNLLVTEDFGKDVVVEKELQIATGLDVLGVLESNAKVEVAYDGGFVQSIEGLSSQPSTKSKKAKDWFYYVNGVLSDVGARDYILESGDTIWWDYHEWGGTSFTPAVIGQYPEPFLHGFGQNKGATVFYADSEHAKNQAKQLETALQLEGVIPIELKPFTDKAFEERKTPCLVVGTWSELKAFKTIEGMNAHSKQTGANAIFTEQGVDLLDAFGNITNQRTAETGLILATGSGMGDKTCAWLVIGTDAKGLESVVECLAKDPKQIKNRVGIVVTKGQLEALPQVCE